MNLATARGVPPRCTLINYGLLAPWAALMILPHGWLHRLWGRRYRISPEQFDTVRFAGIVLHKIPIFIFRPVP